MVPLTLAALGAKPMYLRALRLLTALSRRAQHMFWTALSSLHLSVQSCI